jgi:hypothetical protein
LRRSPVVGQHDEPYGTRDLGLAGIQRHEYELRRRHDPLVECTRDVPQVGASRIAFSERLIDLIRQRGRWRDPTDTLSLIKDFREVRVRVLQRIRDRHDS